MDCNWLLVIVDPKRSEQIYRSIHADDPEEALRIAAGFVAEEHRSANRGLGLLNLAFPPLTATLFREAAEWNGESFVGNATIAASRPVSA